MKIFFKNWKKVKPFIFLTCQGISCVIFINTLQRILEIQKVDRHTDTVQPRLLKQLSAELKKKNNFYHFEISDMFWRGSETILGLSFKKSGKMSIACIKISYVNISKLLRKSPNIMRMCSDLWKLVLENVWPERTACFARSLTTGWIIFPHVGI